MNLEEIATAIGYRTGRGASDGSIKSFVNEALAMYSNDGNWPWLRSTETFTTTADLTEEWSLPYLCRTVDTVNAGGISVGQVSDFSGGRRGWTSDGTTIRFMPGLGAGTTVTVEMYRVEPPLSDMSSTPLISDLNIWPVIDLAASLIMERAGTKQSMEQARVFRGRYDDWRRAQEGQQRRTSTVRIRLRGDYPGASPVAERL